MLRIIKKTQNFKSTIIISIVGHIILFVIGLWKPLKNKTISTPVLVKDKLEINAVVMDAETEEKHYKYLIHQKKNENPFIRKQKKQRQRKIKEVLKRHKNMKNKEKEFPRFKNRVTKTYQKKDRTKRTDTAKAAKKHDEEDIESFLDDLIQTKSSETISNIKKNDKTDKISVEENSTMQDKKKLSKDIRNYANQIKSAIESRFYNASYYSGKTCILRIRLASDGTIIDILPEEGDPSLCRAAISAAHHATIPTPPSSSVYEFFKNASLYFKP